MDDINSIATPQEQPAAVATSRRRISIGIPSCVDPSERRFPLTPEGAKKLVERGFLLKIESDAALPIHYTDNAYTRCGAEITDRNAALSCDIVIHLAPLPVADIRRMRRGAMLLTLRHLDSLTPEVINEMLSMSIIAVAVDRITDEQGHYPFADILAEIDGRAAIASAASILADPERGKGILLGGVAGINPCEVTIIGSDYAAMAAARSAAGLGAIIRMFDDDVYALRNAVRVLGQHVIGSVLQERVLNHALQSADVVIATSYPDKLEIPAEEIASMKTGVAIFDLSGTPGRLFPSLPTFDLAVARYNINLSTGRRVCYINTGSTVPRTAAMALSNTFNTMLNTILTCDGLTNALKLTPGLRNGVMTFLGKLTDQRVARIAGLRATDINIFLQLS